MAGCGKLPNLEAAEILPALYVLLPAKLQQSTQIPMVIADRVWRVTPLMMQVGQEALNPALISLLHVLSDLVQGTFD